MGGVVPVPVHCSARLQQEVEFGHGTCMTSHDEWSSVCCRAKPTATREYVGLGVSCLISNLGGHHPVRGCFRRLPSSARGTHLMTSGDLPRKAQLRLPSIRYMWGPLFRILRHEPHRQAPHVGRGLPAQYATVRNRFSETAARLIIVPTVKSLSRQLAADRWAVLGISTTKNSRDHKKLSSLCPGGKWRRWL